VNAAAEVPAAWSDARLGAILFAIDPVGLGGVALRCWPGPVRDRWLAMARALLPADAPVRRVPLHIEDERLLGGLDLAASLAAGRPLAQRGVLSECDGGVVVLPMAERIDAGTAARFAAAMDQGEIHLERDGLAQRLSARLGLIAIDEGLGPEERPPAALLERLAFHIDLTDVDARDLPNETQGEAIMLAARRLLAEVAPADAEIMNALCVTADMLGVSSLRGPLLALRAARAHAALNGRSVIGNEDAIVAARLVLAPRTMTAPTSSEPTGDDEASNSEDRPESSDPPRTTPDDTPEQTINTDNVLEAIQASLPDDLLSRVCLENQASARKARTQGSGSSSRSANRGRPVGTRAGSPQSGAHLNLVETLRAAAPWQKLRSQGELTARIHVRQVDFRLRRYVQRRQSTTIFVVDASGSTAFARLAEAKGAVELLLAKAYVTRARVALIAFRGPHAELLLPPTRSLTRAKNRLAELPGGGGTPLAAGVEAGLTLARAEQAKDQTPMLVFLTDGRANISRSGDGGRSAAEEDAMSAAREVGFAGIAAVYLDTSARPRPGGDRFALAMGATYVPLPYVDAAAVAAIVGDVRVIGV
jgi:magnesium chelatase subunit D